VAKFNKGSFMNNFLKLMVFVLFVNMSLFLQAQNEKQFKVGCIAFYNIENLFDTINNPATNDEQFLPEGSYQWNSERYFEKLNNLAKVISLIGTDNTPDGPAILGVSEVENEKVLEDLAAVEIIKDRNYQVVHFHGPDRRGVDNALMYNPKYFTKTNAKSHRLTIEGRDNFFTRDQLVVSGYFDDEMMHFIVNHWPSRSGGQKRSEPLRIAAADLTRSIVDSLLNIDPNAKVFVMGDFNDDPVDISVKKQLNTTGNPKRIRDGQLYNPFEKFYRQGIGTLAYRDSWNLFDMILLSPALVGDDRSDYKLYRAGVFNQPWMLQKEGSFKGYPYRTYAGGNYLGGYSDHFPVYTFIIKEVN
jgi:hypothetical protein